MRLRLPASPLRRDVLLALLLSVVTQVEVALADGLDARLGQHLAFLVVTSSIGLRRRAPLAAAIVCAAGMTAQTFAGPAPVAGGFLAMLVVLASLGYYATLARGVAGVCAIGVGALIYDVVGDDFNVGDFVANAAIVVMAWGAAHLVRRSSDARIAAELARERAAREAAAAERARIALDLHDSVAHALTLITLQAGGVAEHTTELRARETLLGIEATGRRALVDVHRMLRLEHGRAGEAPGVQDLVELVDQVRASGLEVELDLEPETGDLSPSVSATAYRVVQEGLTNAVKHSGCARAHVRLHRQDAHLHVEVRNAAEGRPAKLPVGSGRGLEALRERVRLFDGHLEAGPSRGGWLLAASLPLGEDA